MKIDNRFRVYLNENHRRELFGIDLIPENDEDHEITKRFWEGGVFVMGYSTDGRLTLTFEDLIEK